MLKVPFFRVHLSGHDRNEVLKVLKSGWLTTGKNVHQFEYSFTKAVGNKSGVAVNSCTAAMHLALEALNLKKGDKVLVPTMTFAATAEVVRYFDATPIFVDCDPVTLCMDTRHAEHQAQICRPRGIIPMHYGGQMCDMFAVQAIAKRHHMFVVEDAAHTFPAYIRKSPGSAWRSPGQLSDVACFSFYANKCITTGEGGMAVTKDLRVAERMRLMSLHGMNRDAWKRFTAKGSWYYEIVAPGFKYNMTDIAGAIGLSQLAKAEVFWGRRKAIARRYINGLKNIDELELPVELPDRQHSWHLFAIKLCPEKLTIDRATFIDELKKRGIVCSVHWLPLHMQPYYKSAFQYKPSDFPVAASMWPRLISLPIFPSMTVKETEYVICAIKEIVSKFRRL